MNICYSCKDDNSNVTKFTCNHLLCSSCLHRIIPMNIILLNTLNSNDQNNYFCLCKSGTSLLSKKQIFSECSSISQVIKHKCPKHQKEYKQFCFNCDEEICATCIDSDDHADHDTIGTKLRCFKHNKEFTYSKDSLGNPICVSCFNIPISSQSKLKMSMYKELLTQEVESMKAQIDPKETALAKLEVSKTNLLNQMDTKILQSEKMFESLAHKLQEIRTSFTKSLQRLKDDITETHSISKLFIERYFNDIDNINKQAFYNYDNYFKSPFKVAQQLQNLDFIQFDCEYAKLKSELEKFEKTIMFNESAINYSNSFIYKMNAPDEQNSKKIRLLDEQLDSTISKEGLDSMNGELTCLSSEANLSINKLHSEVSFSINSKQMIKASKRLFDISIDDKGQTNLNILLANNNHVNKFLLIPSSSIINVFDQINNYTLLRKLEGHSADVNCLIKFRDHFMASGSDDRTIIIWDTRDFSIFRVLEGHTSSVYALTELQNGYLASGGNDTTIRIWDENLECLHLITGHTDYIQCLLTMSNGWLVSGSGDNLIKIWTYNETYSCKYVLQGHTSYVTSLKQLPNQDLVSISWDSTIIIWSFNFIDQQYKILIKLKTDSFGLSLCILPNNMMASGHMNKKVHIWDLMTLECIKQLDGHSNGIDAITKLKNGSLVSGSPDEVILWDTKTHKKTQVIKTISNDCFFSILEL